MLQHEALLLLNDLHTFVRTTIQSVFGDVFQEANSMPQVNLSGFLVRSLKLSMQIYSVRVVIILNLALEMMF